MSDAFGLLIGGAMLVSGLIGAVWPGAMCALENDPDYPPGPPTAQRLRTMRIGMLVMFLMACALIYAILTADGPAEGPLF